MMHCGASNFNFARMEWAAGLGYHALARLVEPRRALRHVRAERADVFHEPRGEGADIVQALGHLSDTVHRDLGITD